METADYEPVRLEFQKAAQTAKESGVKWAEHLRHEVSSAQYVVTAKWVDDWLGNSAVAKLPVVDWGGQYGQMSALLRHAGYAAENYMVEEPAGWEYFKELNSSVKFSDEADRVKLPYETGSVGAVLSVGVLEHVRQGGTTEAESLAEISRVLAPGGMFFCTLLPNRMSALELSYKALRRWHHKWRYTRSQIESLIAEAGMTIVSHERGELIPKTNFPLTRALGRIIGPYRLLSVDWMLSQVPLIKSISQHHIIVARTLPGDK